MKKVFRTVLSWLKSLFSSTAKSSTINAKAFRKDQDLVRQAYERGESLEAHIVAIHRGQRKVLLETGHYAQLADYNLVGRSESFHYDIGKKLRIVILNHNGHYEGLNVKEFCPHDKVKQVIQNQFKSFPQDKKTSTNKYASRPKHNQGYRGGYTPRPKPQASSENQHTAQQVDTAERNRKLLNKYEKGSTFEAQVSMIMPHVKALNVVLDTGHKSQIFERHLPWGQSLQDYKVGDTILVFMVEYNSPNTAPILIPRERVIADARLLYYAQKGQQLNCVVETIEGGKLWLKTAESYRISLFAGSLIEGHRLRDFALGQELQVTLTPSANRDAPWQVKSYQFVSPRLAEIEVEMSSKPEQETIQQTSTVDEQASPTSNDIAAMLPSDAEPKGEPAGALPKQTALSPIPPRREEHTPWERGAIPQAMSVEVGV